MERKKFWLNDMEAVLGIVAVLIILGTINVFSSSFIISENNYNTPYYFLRHHFVNLSIAIVCGVVGWRIDYQFATPALGKRAQACSICREPRFSDHAPFTVDYAE